MNVPPIFPEQIVIPGNIADASYMVRLGFIRRVVYLHLIPVVVTAASSLYWIEPPVARWWMLWLASLVVLSGLRAYTAPRPLAVAVHWAALLVCCFTTGQFARELRYDGFATVLLVVAALAATLYAALCGRDFSFVGQFVMAWLAIILGAVALRVFSAQTGPEIISGWVLATAWLFYFVYDLAALLTRRRSGEEVFAVTDLVRDLLNFVTYPWRVIKHWRTIRI
ncbi:MAG: hypothetical protein HONBIEJF_01656 [Fimbriimonadaceae bacterium]|nr:hypothetical protein [Fimbriimonadaceae bacterium]